MFCERIVDDKAHISLGQIQADYLGVVMFRVGSTLLTRPKTRFFLTRPDPPKISRVGRVDPDIFFDFTAILGYQLYLSQFLT